MAKFHHYIDASFILFWNFEHSNLDVVSYFDIRFSNFQPASLFANTFEGLEEIRSDLALRRINCWLEPRRL